VKHSRHSSSSSQTLAQSSQNVGEAPRIPNSSPQRTHWDDPLPMAFRLRFSTLSTKWLPPRRRRTKKTMISQPSLQGHHLLV